MKDSLADIVRRLERTDYRNEEHVRVAIVCRLISELGWDIWDPREVNTEFAAVPDEGATRVDVALFVPPDYKRPAVFIEVKAVGRLPGSLIPAEQQLRDYNRNNQAELCVLTDGRLWRFYLPSAAGPFASKFFEEVDLLVAQPTLDDAQLTLEEFLSKDSLKSGRAVESARAYLKRTDRDRLMFEALPLARQDAESDPSKSLRDHFVARCNEQGIECSPDQALTFLKAAPSRATVLPQPTDHGRPPISTPPSKPLAVQRGAVEPSRAATPGVESVLRGRRGTNARGKTLNSGRFLVLAESIAAEPAPKFAGGYREMFDDLVSQRLLIRSNDGPRPVFRLVRDQEFASPSAAASVFLGRSANGLSEWRPT